MSEQKSRPPKDPGFTKTIRDDFKKIKVKDDIGQEYKELKDYYLSKERKLKLENMGGCRKFFLIPWWLLKALFFKLTPFRRILLLIAIISILISSNNQINDENININLVTPALIGGLIFLFILALELKDKLLARTELEEGRAIQQALMPERSPKINGWDIWLFTRSANDVGGDLLDFIKLGDNKYGVAVGDVAGKGLSAALLMAKLQSTIRALAYDLLSLVSLGNKLNKIFNRDSLPKIFASLIYAEISTGSNVIKFINAGHYPPIIIKKDRTEQLKKDAPALGLIVDSRFTEQVVSLEINEFMVIYSDGLTEAQNESGEFYEEERLHKLMKNVTGRSSQQLGEFILSDVDLFIGKTPAHDDLTLAVLKRNV